MYLFIENGSPNLSQAKREMLFVGLLETIDPEDAKLLLAVKNKEIPYPTITKKLVNDAFPGFLKAGNFKPHPKEKKK